MRFIHSGRPREGVFRVGPQTCRRMSRVCRKRRLGSSLRDLWQMCVCEFACAPAALASCYPPNLRVDMVAEPIHMAPAFFLALAGSVLDIRWGYCYSSWLETWPARGWPGLCLPEAIQSHLGRWPGVDPSDNIRGKPLWVVECL